jgi:hypothetical protein
MMITKSNEVNVTIGKNNLIILLIRKGKKKEE